MRPAGLDITIWSAMGSGGARRLLWHRPSLVIGSGAEAELLLEHPQVQPRHALLERADEVGRVTVRALAPEASVYLGARRVSTPEALTPEGVLRVGAFTLTARVLSLEPPPSDVPATPCADRDRLRRLATHHRDPLAARHLFAAGLRRNDPELCLLGCACSPPSTDGWRRLVRLLELVEARPFARVLPAVEAALDAAWPDHLRVVPPHWLLEPGPRHPSCWRVPRAAHLPIRHARPINGAALVRAPAHITHLELRGEEAARELLPSLGEAFPELRVLRVEQARAADWEARLDAVPWPARLESLTLRGLGLEDRALEALLRGSSWAALTHLDLRSNRLGWVSVERLFAAPLPALTHLDLGFNHLPHASSRMPGRVAARSGAPALDRVLAQQGAGQW